MGNWISVDERLPEYDVPVMTFDMNHGGWGQPLCLVDSGEGWLWAGLTAYVGNIYDHDNYECDDEYICTHWQPLPNPPDNNNE